MGGSYSDLNVYFRSRNPESYSDTEYTVNITQGIFTGCSDFQVITHTIKFNPPDNGLNYNVILYDGDKSNNGNYVFGYYYPGDKNQVIEEVRSYYSVLEPNIPLVITFKTKTNEYNCLPGVLKEAGWDRAYNISAYNFSKNLSKDLLDEEFKKKSRERKIKFAIGKEKVDIFGDIQELGNKTNYRFIFIPNGDVSVLGSDYLFAIDFNKNEPICPDDPRPEVTYDCKRVILYHHCIDQQKPEENCKRDINNFALKPMKFPNKQKNKNHIDRYYLQPFDGQLYDGIMVYFDREKKKPPGPLCGRHRDNINTALLLEFIDSSKPKTYLKRKDKDGYCWVEEPVTYTSDKELSTELGQIKEQLDQNAVTVIIDEKRTYNGLDQFEPDDKNKTCAKYTYKFKAANKPNIIFGRKKITIGKNDISSIQVKHVEVYYLNAGGKEDKQPFLIVFDQNGEDKDDKKKAYHFTNTDKFDDWQEFQFKEQEKTINGDKLIKKLYEKVKKIETNGSCVPELSLLRWYAYQILIDPEISKPPEPPTEPPERPPEEKPEDQPKPLPMPWIIGGSVGGVVFVGSSAVGYGIYWYNTTIKLLT